MVMPDEPKVVPIPKPPLPTRARAIASHGLLRDQIIVSIGPLVVAVDYALKITELQGVPGDGPGRVLSISEAVKPRRDEANHPYESRASNAGSQD